jgi:soluble lytic murein transglycosylase-like protein
MWSHPVAFDARLDAAIARTFQRENPDVAFNRVSSAMEASFEQAVQQALTGQPVSVRGAEGREARASYGAAGPLGQVSLAASPGADMVAGQGVVESAAPKSFPVARADASGPSSATPGGVGQWREMIATSAARHRVPAWLVENVLRVESGGNPKATSPVGAMGLMQLMPGTARDLGVVDPYDPGQNLDGGVRYLADMIRRFDGNLEKAVAAYNAGPGAVQRFSGVPPYSETQRYVEKVLDPDGA